MTKISYICPVYNKIKYLPFVLKSIYNQNGNFDKEYIFIDDGSNDGSYEYIKNFSKKKKNTQILSQKNRGPAFATQRGIEKSSGDFIKLVGGDDILSPNCSANLLKVIKKNSSVAVFSAYSEFKKINDIEFQEEKIKNLRIIKSPLESTIKSNYSGTSPNLYCGKAIKQSGGCYKELFVEDFSLVLRLSLLGSFSFIDNISSYGPVNDENRIMIGKKNQLLHDYNAAIYLFLREFPDLEKKIKKIACLKCLGRADKWIRRERKKSIFNEINFLRLKYFFKKKKEEEYVKKSCEVFYKFSKTNPIRYKI